MSQSSWTFMLMDEACFSPSREGPNAMDCVVSSCRSSPMEPHTAPSSRRASLGAAGPLSPANPCWALDTSTMISPVAKDSSPTSQYTPVSEGHFGGYAWPRVVPPAGVFSIWNRSAPSW